jgi:hypothetical protein
LLETRNQLLAARLKLDENIFGLREKSQGLKASFAANPRLLDSTKGRAQVANEPAVDPNYAGIDLVRHAVCAL